MGDGGKRACLVTGSSRGIGRAVAERLGKAGSVVAVHCRSERDTAQQVVATIRAQGGEAFAVSADLSRTDGVETLFDGVERGLAETVGDVALDVLVNNAGVGCRGELGTISAQALDRAFAVNARAPLMVLQRALTLLRDGGRVINMSSLSSRESPPGIVGYAMTKGALDVMSRTVAGPLGERGITVNAVAPGIVDTAFHDAWWRENPGEPAAVARDTALGRLGEAADVADVVDFLASDGGRWVTGERIEVSGGLRR